jgi:hypothetical protein
MNGKKRKDMLLVPAIFAVRFRLDGANGRIKEAIMNESINKKGFPISAL